MKLEHIWKSYDGSHAVLKDFSYDFQKGKIYVVKGVSGCGKTTLLNIMGRLDRDYKGNITDDDDVIGFVLQQSLLFSNWTVGENLAFICNDIKKVQATARMLSVEGLLDKYPDQISGGERQRISVVRALLNNPTLLLADEPASNLDAINSKLVAEAFCRASNEKNTIVIVTHKTCFDSIADEIIDLDYGVIRGVEHQYAGREVSGAVQPGHCSEHRNNRAGILSLLFKKNRKLFNPRNVIPLVFFIFLLFACTSVGVNFESEYVHFVSQKYPSDVFAIPLTRLEAVQSHFDVTLYKNYVIEGDGFEVCSLLDREHSALAYGTVIAYGAFPEPDEVLIDQAAASLLFHTEDYGSVVGKKINIKGTEYTVSGVIGNLEEEENESLLYSNTYYQPVSDYQHELPPRVYMPYQTIAKIGTEQPRLTVMASIDGLYEGKDQKYLRLRELLESGISSWDGALINAQSTLDLVLGVVLASILMIAVISLFFQKSEVELNMTYRRREIGGLQLFGLKKGQVFLYLLFERWSVCFIAMICAILVFLGIGGIAYLTLRVWIFIPVWTVLLISLVVLLYNTLLIGLAGRRILKRDIVELLR